MYYVLLMTNDTATKATSLDRVIAALDIHGWTYTIDRDAQVRVPDTETGVQRIGARRRIPRKMVPGVIVKASNGVEGTPTSQSLYSQAHTNVHFAFTAEGKFAPESSVKHYPFASNSGPTMAKILDVIAKQSLAAFNERARQRAEHDARKEAEEIAAVAAHYERRHAELIDARTNAALRLTEMDAGLTGIQIRMILDELCISTSPLAQVTVAQQNFDNAAKGYGTGRSYLTLTYVDGKPVS